VTPKQVKKVCARIDRTLKARGHRSCPHPSSSGGACEWTFEHMRYMARKTPTISEPVKQARWLGFLLAWAVTYLGWTIDDCRRVCQAPPAKQPPASEHNGHASEGPGQHSVRATILGGRVVTK
jgi:hypothetical protein